MKFDDLNREMVIELKQAYLLQRYWRKNKSISWNELETNTDSLMSDDEIHALVGDCEFNENNFKCNSSNKGVTK